eukprot:UN16365
MYCSGNFGFSVEECNLFCLLFRLKYDTGLVYPKICKFHWLVKYEDISISRYMFRCLKECCEEFEELKT